MRAATKPVDVNCARKALPAHGIKRLTLRQLFSANLEVDLSEPQRLHFNVIILITKGKCAHMIDFAPFPLHPRDLLLLRNGQVHAFAKEHPLEGEILTFTPEFVGTLDGMPSIAEPLTSLFDAGPKLSLSEQSAVFVQKCFKELSGDLARPGTHYREPLAAYSFALLVNRLAALEEFTTASEGLGNQLPGLVKNFTTLVQTNFLRRRDPAWYAKKLHVSTRTLDRRLADSLRRTCKELITERLVLEAKRLLTDPALQIKGVAHSLGFDEVANFSRFFRHNAGITPRDFRRDMPDWPL